MAVSALEKANEEGRGEGEPSELSTKRPGGTESLTIHMVRPGRVR